MAGSGEGVDKAARWPWWSFQAWLDRVTLGHRPTDSRSDRTIKSVMVLVSLVFILLNLRTHASYVAGESWMRHYLNYGLTVSVWLPILLIWLRVRPPVVFKVVMAVWLANHVFWHFIEGNPGNFAIFMLMLPIGSILVLGSRRSLPFLGLFVLLVIAVPAVDPWLPVVPIETGDPYFAGGGGLFHSALKGTLDTLSFVYLAVFGCLIYLSLFLVLRERDRARAQVEALLLNALPREVVERLNREDRGVSLTAEPELAEEFSAVTVLFADIVGFTPLSAKTSPARLVTILNDIFTRFDALAEKHGVEKIKTIGDAYMAVSGVPTPVADHAARVMAMAGDMLDEIVAFRDDTGLDLSIRIGVNTGPVVAGVIGQRRFAYDLWGDTVNLASRMESHGEPDCVHVSEATYRALDGGFACVPRGEIEIKGKGKLRTWWLVREGTGA